MRRIIGACFVSLDGVMQAPGGPEEDESGDFALGGWLFPFFDEAAGAQIDKLFTPPFDLLLGRRTYDIFAAFWPYATGDHKPMGEMFDRAGKYVVTGGDQPLAWQNSHRVEGIDALAALRRSDGPDLIIQGSSTLYPQLLSAGLLDRLILMTFPAIIGTGKRLFGDGTPPGAWRMIEHQVAASGNIFATYEPDGAIEPGNFGAEEPSAAELERQAKIREGRW